MKVILLVLVALVYFGPKLLADDAAQQSELAKKTEDVIRHLSAQAQELRSEIETRIKNSKGNIDNETQSLIEDLRKLDQRIQTEAKACCASAKSATGQVLKNIGEELNSLGSRIQNAAIHNGQQN